MNNLTAPINYGHRLERATSSRHQRLGELFQSPLFSLTSMMGPLSNGPQWPSDAGWLVLRHGDGVTIVSDGLSDPWVETNRLATGLGLEVYVETPDVALSEDEPMAVADAWIFPMVAEISHTLASYPRLCEKLLSGEPLSLRFNIEHIKDGRGLVGALLHIPPTESELTIATGNIALVAATLLTTQELRWLAGRGEAGRRELLAALYQQGIGRRSLLQRQSVKEP